MKPITVRSEREYEVLFSDFWGANLESRIQDRKFVVLTQETLRERVSNFVSPDSIIIAPEGEEQKTLTTFSEILEELARRELDRNSLVIGIGGGATTDLAGFLAATYMRGIDWIAIPTSIAGMVDASIGGKTGVNLAAAKNLVGAFHSPCEVIIDMTWLTTLQLRDIRAGLAESLKCGFISDPTILDLFRNGYEENLAEIIYRSIEVKASIVSVDFKENFARETLNYGHTLGHAIEQDSKYQLRHGEAISIGMVFAAELSHSKAGLSKENLDLHYELITRLELPISYEKSSWPHLVELMTKDKKRRGEGLRFVTLRDIAATDRLDIEPGELRQIYEEKIGR